MGLSILTRESLVALVLATRTIRRTVRYSSTLLLLTVSFFPVSYVWTNVSGWGLQIMLSRTLCGWKELLPLTVLVIVLVVRLGTASTMTLVLCRALVDVLTAPLLHVTVLFLLTTLGSRWPPFGRCVVIATCPPARLPPSTIAYVVMVEVVAPLPLTMVVEAVSP